MDSGHPGGWWLWCNNIRKNRDKFGDASKDRIHARTTILVRDFRHEQVCGVVRFCSMLWDVTRRVIPRTHKRQCESDFDRHAVAIVGNMSMTNATVWLTRYAILQMNEMRSAEVREWSRSERTSQPWQTLKWIRFSFSTFLHGGFVPHIYLLLV